VIKVVFVFFLFFLHFENVAGETSDVLAEDTSEKIEFPMRQEAPQVSLQKISIVFVFLMAAVFLVIYLLKKYIYKLPSASGVSACVQHLESKKITTKLTVHVVKVDSESYLIAEKNDSLVLSKLSNTE
jgi:flagellar biogenesis protein FliO